MTAMPPSRAPGEIRAREQMNENHGLLLPAEGRRQGIPATPRFLLGAAWEIPAAFPESELDYGIAHPIWGDPADGLPVD